MDISNKTRDDETLIKDKQDQEGAEKPKFKRQFTVQEDIAQIINRIETIEKTQADILAKISLILDLLKPEHMELATNGNAATD